MMTQVGTLACSALEVLEVGIVHMKDQEASHNLQEIDPKLTLPLYRYYYHLYHKWKSSQLCRFFDT